ncbi:MAG: MarR family winged helix-turn-helix transcriptional regulator [Janthinobacterium lividum]
MSNETNDRRDHPPIPLCDQQALAHAATGSAGGDNFFDTYLVEDSVGYLLARARTRLAKRLDLALAEFGITNAQGSIVLMLMTGKYSTAAELARELYIDAASMTRMVDRLEKRCLIQRERTRDDRRVVKLLLTDSGRHLGARLPAVYGAVVKHSFARFSSDELASLRALLRKSLEDDGPGCGLAPAAPPQ